MTRRKSNAAAPQRRTVVSSPPTKNCFANRPWLLALVLVVVTFVAYQPVQHAGFIWDDDDHVTENVNLRSLHGLHRIWLEPLASPQYYPLQLTSYWVEYHLWGLRPFGYHAVNVLLQILNALLLWVVLQELEIPGAWLAAAVFAIHPVQVESVAWVSELKNLLSATFYLGSLLAFFQFRPLSGKAQSGSPPWRFYWLANALFLCALLSKTVACSLPAVLVLLIWWKQGRLERQDIKLLSPMFLLGITLGLMTAWLEKHHANAIGAEWSLSFLQRCLLAGRVLWFYAGKLFWPHPLIFIYPHWEIDSGAWWQYLFPVTALAVFLALWSLRSRIGRGPLVAVLCFGCTLFPALGFFNVYPFRYSYVADHFQYLACIGLISLAVSMGAAICTRAGQWGRDLGTGAAAIVLLALGLSTWKQAHIYQNLETLWGDTLVKNPQCWMARLSLGTVFLQEGNVSDAIGYFEQALRTKPDYAEAHSNLGIALAQTGNIEEAIARFQQALRINPDYAGAHYNLGIALAQTGNIEEAIAHFQQALRIEPDYAEAHNNLGIALYRTGRHEEAIEHFQQALRINPDYAEAHTNLGTALAQTGKIEDAIAHCQQALRIKPDYAEAHYSWGMALEQADRAQEAIGHYEQALRIKPDFTPARNALARLQAGQ